MEEIFLVFVAFQLFAIAAVVEAPPRGMYGYGRQLFSQLTQPSRQRRSQLPQKQQQQPQQFQGHYQQTAYSPRGSKKRSPPPTDPIPIYCHDRASVYELQIPQSRENVYYYSRNMEMDFNKLKRMWATTVLQDKKIVTMRKIPPFDRMAGAAANHLEAYADYWHGDIPPYQRKWSSTGSKIKRIRSDHRGATYQVYVHLQTTDGTLQMCCNLLLRMKEVSQPDFAYRMGCAQPACFPIPRKSASRGRNGRNTKKCYYLNIVHDLETMEYPYCVKEL